MPVLWIEGGREGSRSSCDLLRLIELSFSIHATGATRSGSPPRPLPESFCGVSFGALWRIVGISVGTDQYIDRRVRSSKLCASFIDRMGL